MISLKHDKTKNNLNITDGTQSTHTSSMKTTAKHKNWKSSTIAIENSVKESNSAHEEGSNWCKEKKVLIGTDQEDVYTLVDARLHSTVTLACHYCNEFDDENPKVWYKKTRDPNDKEEEVETDFSERLTDSRLFIMTDHTLVIQNVSEADDGVYFCHGPLGEDTDFNYNYVIDIITDSPLELITEDAQKAVTDHAQEQKLFSKIDEMNLKFTESNGSDYVRLRDEGILMSVMSIWAPWDPCNGCLKIKKRKRRCYIRPTPISNETKVISEEKVKEVTNKELSIEQNAEKAFLLQYDFGCRSLRLAKLFPNISADLGSIPEYYITEKCYAPCLKYKKKGGGPKYENLFIIEQGSSAKFICPESTYNDKVTWKKGKSTIEPLRKDTHLQVDMFSTLYLHSVTYNQNGNYTCFINNEPIQRINIVVKTKSIFQTKEFAEHSQYLGMVLVVCFIIYLIGVISACTQRKNFKIIDFKKDDVKKKEDHINLIKRKAEEA